MGNEKIFTPLQESFHHPRYEAYLRDFEHGLATLLQQPELFAELFEGFQSAHITPLEEIPYFEHPANNFDRFFYPPKDNIARNALVFRRFSALFPDFCAQLTEKTTRGSIAMKTTYDPNELPWEELKDAYFFMSHLVDPGDFQRQGLRIAMYPDYLKG